MDGFPRIPQFGPRLAAGCPATSHKMRPIVKAIRPLTEVERVVCQDLPKGSKVPTALVLAGCLDPQLGLPDLVWCFSRLPSEATHSSRTASSSTALWPARPGDGAFHAGNGSCRSRLLLVDAVTRYKPMLKSAQLWEPFACFTV